MFDYIKKFPEPEMIGIDSKTFFNEARYHRVYRDYDDYTGVVTTLVVILNNNGNELIYGASFCNPYDEYNKRIGRNIALMRAVVNPQIIPINTGLKWLLGNGAIIIAPDSMVRITESNIVYDLNYFKWKKHDIINMLMENILSKKYEYNIYSNEMIETAVQNYANHTCNKLFGTNITMN